MKILYLITGLGLGGAEKVVCDLADKMVENGHEVKIAYLTGEIFVRPKSISIELVCLNLNRFISFYTAFKIYKNLINSFKPDIVHAHMIHANIFTRLSRVFISIPRLICSAHSNNEGGGGRMLAYKFTHSLADVTTNVSKNASNNFELLGAVPLGQIKTIYNGINLKKFNVINSSNENIRNELGISNENPLFLAIGRFSIAKDYPNLLNAFAEFKKSNIFREKYPKLLIAGDGGLRSELELLIKNLQLEKDIILLGMRNDIPNLLNIANFFVLSSKYEGLPTVVIEAMACETFVIATDCGGSREIMGDTGILVPSQNSQFLAQALSRAIDKTPQEIKDNNCKARQRVEKLFSLEKSVETWLDLYEQK